MRVVRFIILGAILGGCCLLGGCVVENDDNNDDVIVAPEYFVPDSDGDYNVFEVTSKGNNVVSLKIYTRAGVLVFSIEAKRCRWDGCSLSGQPMAGGVYYYTAEIRDLSPKISKSGFVHLYR